MDLDFQDLDKHLSIQQLYENYPFFQAQENNAIYLQNHIAWLSHKGQQLSEQFQFEYNLNPVHPWEFNLKPNNIF